MVGRRVNWIISALTKEMHGHFWYKGKKENDLVDNKKMQNLVVTTLMKTCDIRDVDVALNVLPGNYALVIFFEHRHIVYIVHNLAEEWTMCNCVWALRGNICKHVVKIMFMLQTDIAKGTIPCLCGKHVGTVIGGIRELFTPLPRFVIRNFLMTLPRYVSQSKLRLGPVFCQRILVKF